MTEYAERIKRTVESLNTPPVDDIKFGVILEEIIQIRTDVIKDYHKLSPEQRQIVGFQLDQMDRLYANRFEHRRIIITDKIAEKYREED